MTEDDPEKKSVDLNNSTNRYSTWLLLGGIGVLVIILAVFLISSLIGDWGSSRQEEADVSVMRETLTPTSTKTPAPTATVTPTPPGSTPMAVEPDAGFTFEGVRIQPDQGSESLLIYGEAVNNTSAALRILGIDGTYFDAEGGAISPQEVSDYWPIESVPPGWRMPFELTLSGITLVDRVELQVITEDSDNSLRTDLAISEVEGTLHDGEYCVLGSVRNPGQPLTSHIMVVGVLYDEQDQVINWGIGYQPAPENLTGDESVVASACAEHFNHIVDRYELRAWGE